jgi:hypothetical protein
MQRLCLSLLVAGLLLPAVALAANSGAKDGTLVVRNADAKVYIWKANGTVYGRLASGKLIIDDSNPIDENEPEVYGAEQVVPNYDDEGMVTYSGKAIRFRFFGGGYTIRIQGTGINLSAVGRGNARLSGLGTPLDGDYGDFAVNGSKFQALSALPTTVAFPPPPTVTTTTTTP